MAMAEAPSGSPRAETPEETRKTPSEAPRRCNVRKTMRNIRILFRALGIVVCLLWLSQIAFIIAHPPIEEGESLGLDGFKEFCDWIGKITLGLLVGVCGVILEIQLCRGGVLPPRDGNTCCAKCVSCLSYMLSRLGLTIFYLWLGVYAFGGMGVADSGEVWDTLTLVTTIMAWTVAVGDLLLSFSCDRRTTKEERLASRKNSNAESADEEVGHKQPSGSTEQPPTSVADVVVSVE